MTETDKERKKREAWEAQFPPGKDIIVVKAVGLNKGHDGTPSTKHGFYRAKLQPDEQVIYEDLYADFRAKYDLDNAADDLSLSIALTNFIKACREEPTTNPGDKNVRSYQAFYESKFFEGLTHLGLTRKVRKEESSSGEVAKTLQAMFGKPEEQAGTGPEESGQGEQGGL